MDASCVFRKHPATDPARSYRPQMINPFGIDFFKRPVFCNGDSAVHEIAKLPSILIEPDDFPRHRGVIADRDFQATAAQAKYALPSLVAIAQDWNATP